MPENSAMVSVSSGILATMENNSLVCRLHHAGPSRKSGVKWVLHRGDFDQRRASEPVDAGDVWRVKLPDTTSGFVVRAEVDGVVYQSEWFQRFGSDVTGRYKLWREEWSRLEGVSPTEIPLFRYEPPFENIAFACHRSDVDLTRLAALAESNGLLLSQHSAPILSQLTVLSGSAAPVDAGGRHYAFSGITRDSKRLLVGTEDVQRYVVDVDELRDQIGEFHLLAWNKERISFEHDYIGQGHLFYYQSDGFLVAANGLHLLALVLRALGVDLRLNVEQIKSKFFSTSYPFETEQSCETSFEGVRRVSVYERIEVDSTGLRLEKTELWHDNLGGELSPDKYEELLSEATHDVIDNVKVALEHDGFDRVVCELSAGLDSRIIYCALTNLPPSQKVRIYTRRGAEEGVAATINGLYGYAWDDVPRRHSYDKKHPDDLLPATSHSVFMDGYYIESMFKPRQNYAMPTLVLTGHGGEAFSRVMSIEGYFARDFAGHLPSTVVNAEEVYRNVVRYVGNHQVWLDAGKHFFRRTLEDSLAESPAITFPQRFADLYVSQRNPFVGGSVFRGAMSAPQWRPLQSKALFRLKSLWFQTRQDYRLQFDLIRKLNPLISEVPYHKPVVDAWKEEFDGYRAPFPIAEPIRFKSDIDSLSAARRRSDGQSTWSPSKAEHEAVQAAVKAYEESAEGFLEPLGHILALAPVLDDLGLPLFSYADRVLNRSNPRAFSKRHNVRNKLHILLQEVLLVVNR